MPGRRGAGRGIRGTAAQAEALIGLEQAEARHTAARAKILTAFSAGHGFQADGQYGAKPWLRAFTKVTRGAAAGTAEWARRLADHPVLAAALADAQLSASWARQICDWTDPYPKATAATRTRSCWRRLRAARTCTTWAPWPGR